MTMRNGAVDLSEALGRAPRWEEFVAAVEHAGAPTHVYLLGGQAAAIAFSEHAKVLGPGHISTEIGVDIWTEDSEPMGGRGI
jgi:hypothetical protein